MPYIILPSLQRVFVTENYFCQQEMHLSSLLGFLSSNNVNYQKSAARTLGSLNTLGESAIPALESIVYSHKDTELIQLCLNAIEKIAPHRKDHIADAIKNRMQMLDQKQTQTTETPAPAKKKLTEVDIVQTKMHELEGVKVSRKCNFCEKETIAYPETQRLTEKLCHPNKFYCNFCLRHNLNTKSNKHVLMMSFRAIFGYYYYEYYHQPKIQTMYLSEIQDYINLHRDIGLQNPVFSYDPESYTWFVDFRRVGASKKKIDLKDVKCTVIDILASFNLASIVTNISMCKLYQKYEEAIDDFYKETEYLYVRNYHDN
jgi:hypothetical protein